MLALCDIGEDPLTHWPPRGQRPELVVDRARGPIGKHGREWIEEIKPAGAGAAKRVLDVRQLRLEHQPQSRHEVVRLPELRDSVALPVLPRRLRRGGEGIGVVFEQSDVVSVACEQKGGTETADSATNDQDGHDTPY